MEVKRTKDIMKIGRVSALLGILKLSDEEAYIHCLDVAEITEIYFNKEEKRLKKSRSFEEKDSILIGALLHDIGKAFLPFGLQHSERNFTAEEREVIKMHPLLGTVAVKNCDFDEIVTNIILMHHAHSDGTGYPIINNQVYNSENVPEYVWIISFADKLAAMIGRRNFKAQKSLSEAWKDLVSLSKEQEKLPYEKLLIFKDVINEMDIFKEEKEEESWELC